MLSQVQEGALWAATNILFGIVLELSLAVERSLLVKVEQGHTGTYVLVFECYDIVDSCAGL